jgi:hypothetical protein
MFFRSWNLNRHQVLAAVQHACCDAHCGSSIMVRAARMKTHSKPDLSAAS